MLLSIFPSLSCCRSRSVKLLFLCESATRSLFLLIAVERREEGSQTRNVWRGRQYNPALETRHKGWWRSSRARKSGLLCQRFHLWLPSVCASGANIITVPGTRFTTAAFISNSLAACCRTGRPVRWRRPAPCGCAAGGRTSGAACGAWSTRDTLSSSSPWRRS